MSRKTRILQIPNYLYPNFGGIEQVARDIANALSEAENVEQKIICFNETAQDGNYVCNRKETVHDVVDGVEVVRCGCITKVASQSVSLTYRKELKKMMKSFKPDIVVFHYPNPFVATLLLPELKDSKIKLVLYWHLDIVKQKYLRILFGPQNKQLLKRAYKIVATSPNYIEGSEWLSSEKEKCVVVPNCMNVERMEITPAIEQRAAEIRDENKGKIICVGVGRHVPYKGFTYLVQASRLLDDRFKIYITGKGELTESLKAEAEGDDKITFAGRVSDDELKALLLSCDIFCFPSITKNEAFGLALAEAMYYGKPAVTFTIPGSGVNYVSLNGVTGIEVENRNVKNYASAMKKLADKPELRKQYGEAARKRVEENFLSTDFKKNVREVLLKI